MKRRLNICVLDADKERCKREERALEEAILMKNLQTKVTGAASYGQGHIQRSGYDGPFPVVTVDGLFFHKKNEQQEYTRETFCSLLDMLTEKGVICS